MPIRILVVDDSGFFCQQLTSILTQDAEMKVVGIASNGEQALEKVKALKPDVVTMDVEMPVMDGITAVRRIMAEQPLPILMLSSLTYDGARLTLDALAAGAVDFQLKSYESLAATHSISAQQLRAKVKAVASSRLAINNHCCAVPKLNSLDRSLKNESATETDCEPTTGNNGVGYHHSTHFTAGTDRQNLFKTLNTHSDPATVRRANHYRVLIIGSSTGGSVVVEKILTALPADFPVPIIAIQHMPAKFTGAFASRLNRVCQLTVLEAEDHSRLSTGSVLVAPGGKQIYFEKNLPQAVIRIKAEDPRVNYQPCIDISFASAAKTFDSGVLALVLTGMGADGRDGAKLLKQKKSQVWAQDESSCVVYGMPGAVVNAGLADKILGADEFSSHIIREIMA